MTMELISFGTGLDRIRKLWAKLRKRLDIADAYYNRGIKRYEQKKYRDALNDFDLAVQIKPERAEVYYYRGLAFSRSEMYQEAIDDFSIILNLGGYEDFKGLAYNERGYAYYMLGKYHNMIEYYHKAIDDYDQAIRLGVKSALRNHEIAQSLLNEIRRKLHEVKERAEAERHRRIYHLRKEPIKVSFFDARKDFKVGVWSGKPLEYCENDFEDNGNRTITDHATGLMWQKSVSGRGYMCTEAETYILKLNSGKFAGYTDWRLPTVDELKSLITPKKITGNRFIDPIFDTPGWCWSSDIYADGRYFVAFDYFNYGCVLRESADTGGDTVPFRDVRAVRSAY